MFLDRTPDAIPLAPPANPVGRRAERIAFDLLVRYSWHGQRATAMLKDLTRFGARIEGIRGLRADDGLTLLLPALRPIDARVVWADGHSAGLSFEAAIPARPFNAIVRDFATGRTPHATPSATPLSRAA